MSRKRLSQQRRALRAHLTGNTNRKIIGGSGFNVCNEAFKTPAAQGKVHQR
jgi:hypothetical protein